MKTLFRWIRRLLLVLVILILCILLPVLADRAISKIHGNFLTLQEQQIEDLNRLDYLFRNEFGGYEALPGRLAFQNSLDRLKEEVSLEALAAEEFSLRVIRTVSAFRDPHTMVYNRNDLLPEVFPYYLEWVGGSFYLTSGKVDEKWLGARVLRIGNSSGQEAFDRMQVFTNAPNESGKSWFIRSWMRTAHALVSQDIISDPESIALTVIQEGDTATLNFKSMPYEEINALSDYLRLSSLSGEETWPLWKKGAGQNYRMEYLENSQTLYVRYSMCVSQGDVESFWENVFRSIEQEKPDRLVVDVRGNPGGDSKTHASFLARLSQDTLVNQFGKLFVLTDGGTGSAAVSFTADMERLTWAILVGEPTMDAPNTTSDPTFFTLPHSGITLLLPSLYSLHSYSGDPRKGIFPHIPVTASAGLESYLYDPVLDTVLAMNLYDKMPEGMHSSTLTEGCYTFSHLRNLTVANEGGTWTVAVDGLFKAPLRWSQNAWQSHTYGIRIQQADSTAGKILLEMHGVQRTLNRISQNERSLVRAMEEKDYEEVRKQLNRRKDKGEWGYDLDRPFFQQRTYSLYSRYGYEAAASWSELLGEFFADDPVIPVVHFELASQEGDITGQVMQFMRLVTRVTGRYWDVITSDRLMNDDYNPFIGRSE